MFLKLLYLLSAACLVAATNGEGLFFTNPSSEAGIKPVWELGEERVITWKTTLDVTNISLLQKSPNGLTASNQEAAHSDTDTSYRTMNSTWTVQTYDFNLGYSKVFFFRVSSDDAVFDSAYFTIIESDSIPSPTKEILAPASSAKTTRTEHLVPRTRVNVPLPGLTPKGRLAVGLTIDLGVPILATIGAIHNMDRDTKTLQPPPQAYAPTGPSTYDYESQRQIPKNNLRTWSQVRQEWKYGSKSRVVKYYIAYFLIGFIVGGIVGTIIGLIFRFT
ncbi:hypothetical protein BJX70DRAFT_393638 [Aspergillus crustosus]